MSYNYKLSEKVSLLAKSLIITQQNFKIILREKKSFYTANANRKTINSIAQLVGR